MARISSGTELREVSEMSCDKGTKAIIDEAEFHLSEDGAHAIARDLLEQWTCSPERVAGALARLLGIRRSAGDSTALRWDVGVLNRSGSSSERHEWRH
ncbi:MAG: hypothetical protein J0M01_03200 [Dechloromonas sp.]|jgi:hypothetical protein|nr:hypothetical protein [Dechloromonas sp.]